MMTVYFDNAATTAVRREAADAAYRVMTEQYGNPSSTHTMGREAKKLLDEARRSVADAIGAKEQSVYFTSGGTEADNWAVEVLARLTFRRGKHVITTAVEHDAIRQPLQRLASQGWEITSLEPDENGRITAEDFARALRPDTAFATVMLVNNETGAVNPISELARIIRGNGYGTLLHTDAVQALCKVPFSVRTLGADMISLSSRKIHGPKGAGALYAAPGLNLTPLILGGGQERGLRSGTEALPALVGFGTAAALGHAEMKQSIAHMRRICALIEQGIRERLPEAVILSPGDAPHILSLSLPGYKSEVLMNCLEADGIFVSKSSACKKGGRSHVLEAMKLPARVIDGAIRVSVSKFSTPQEAEFFIERLRAAADRLVRV